MTIEQISFSTGSPKWSAIFDFVSKAKGKYGEELAERFLLKQGFEILEKNYRHKRSEIDLIGLKDNELLVFFEVKFRSSSDFGDPETFVSDTQIKKIKEAADDYIHGINWQKDIRFDIISIDQNDQIEHFEDAFY